MSCIRCICEDCIHWDGKTGREMWKDECPKYKTTEGTG